ncbi:hypothetical protein K7X08_031323 [Anisodus acutangulus]|uniref:Uncharacterized protein n=1 Tax=Anisodus acutangulus TaxID=402998 RepID=A0A9Q1MP52_9SOLA|nr:hypothetical protein K7X08_031323 [Anisodus acutangulus]
MKLDSTIKVHRGIQSPRLLPLFQVIILEYRVLQNLDPSSTGHPFSLTGILGRKEEIFSIAGKEKFGR